MKHIATRYLLTASTCLLAVVAFAQSSNALGNNPHPSTPATSTPAALESGGTRIAIINLEQVIFATNEGRKAFEDLGKQLNTQGDSLNDMARNALARQIETKQKVFDRDMQDARDDANSEQQDIEQRILQKLAPMVVKYAAQNGYGVILDSGKLWPQTPLVWFGQTIDITKQIVEEYNAQSGAPAPAPAAAHPGTKPSGAAATKPEHK
jgi:outer membrane protein